MILDLTLEKEGSHADDECIPKMEKRNSRQRFSRSKGKEEQAAPRCAESEEVQFCKNIKCRAAHKAGRWEEVEES